MVGIPSMWRRGIGRPVSATSVPTATVIPGCHPSGKVAVVNGITQRQVRRREADYLIKTGRAERISDNAIRLLAGATALAMDCGYDRARGPMSMRPALQTTMRIRNDAGVIIGAPRSGLELRKLP